jgi:ABC-type transport system involved in multi-copper enzyme maturation permease subunit
MMAEPEMINRRMLDRRNWSNQHTAAVVVAGVFYLIFLLTVLPNAATVESSIFLYIMMIVVLFVVPITLHGVIAGEREKRSLDMLLAAPVTSAEIVWAKLHRARGLVASTMLFLGGPLALVLIAQVISPGRVFGPPGGLPAFAGAIFGLGSVLAAAFASGGITILISSHAKNGASSLMTNLAVHFGLLAGFPFVLEVLLSAFPNGYELGALPWLVHPIGILTAATPGTLTQLEVGLMSSKKVVAIGMAVWVLYATIGLCCLQLAARRLDKERRV